MMAGEVLGSISSCTSSPSGESWQVPVLFPHCTLNDLQPALLRKAQGVRDVSSGYEVGYIVVDGGDSFVGLVDASSCEALEAKEVEGVEHLCRCLASLSH